MSTFNELIDFTRSTTGTYLDSVVYGPELVTNGTFDNNVDGWSSYSSALSWESGGYLRATQTGAYGGAFQNISVEIGKSYVYEISTVGGTASVATIQLKGTGQAIAYKPITVGEKGFLYFVATASTVEIDMQVQSPTSGLYVDFDNASVKEVIGGQVSGTPLLRTAAINEPRLEYDASGNPLGLLIEEARANQAKHSEDWTLYPWTLRENSFSSSTNSIAPDGTAGATRFYTNSNVPAFLQQSCGGNVGAKTHTVSCWVRSTNGGADQTFRLKCTHSGVTDFFSNDKTATSEWKRFTFTETFISASNTAVIAGVVEDSSINQLDIEVWGMQVEFDSSFPTSYIPTSGSTVTRTADIASLPVERFAYNQSKGSVVVAARPLQVGEPSVSQALLEIGTADRSQIYLFARLSGTSQSRFLANNGSNQADLRSSDFVGGSLSKMSAGWAVNNFSMSMDGGTAVVDTAGAVMTGCTIMGIGTLAIPSTNFLNGHIKQIQYYPKRLSNTELELLTQPSASPTMNLTFDGQATSTLVEGLHD